jgi:hypothetical protein
MARIIAYFRGAFKLMPRYLFESNLGSFIKGGGLDAIDTPLQIPESLRLVLIKPLAKQSRRHSV